MIQKKDVFKKIGAIIVEISEQYQYLSENPEQLNDLELELFSANADFLSEHVKVLRKLNSSESIPAVTPATPVLEKTSSAMEPGVQTPSPEHQEAVVELMKEESHKPEDSIVEDRPRLEEQRQPEHFATPEVPQQKLSFEPVIGTVQEPVEPKSVPVVQLEKEDEIIPSINVVQEPVVSEPLPKEISPEPELKHEGPGTAPLTLNDIISAQKAQSIQTNPQFATPAITDLKTSISLNDKLLFIKELFNGYSLAYSEAIEILNRFDSFEIAENFLKKNYASKNSWETKQDAVEKFYDILQRRYSK